MSRAIATMAVALSMSLALAACGGSAATTDNSGAAAQEGGEAAKAEQKGNNWMSADDLQALLESDYDYVNDSELSNMDDENDKIHRESIENEDGTVRHFVDINYDGKTNEITSINWYYSMQDSDIDYWTETLGLVVTNPDDQQILKDTLSEIEDMEMRDAELSDADLHAFRYGEGDDWPIMNVSLTRR